MKRPFNMPLIHTLNVYPTIAVTHTLGHPSFLTGVVEEVFHERSFQEASMIQLLRMI
jgi:hypothetical protein